MPHTTEQFATANGMQLCYDTFGRASDPPIVLVMGLASQMILWEDDLCKALAARGFWVIRFDNRDIGKSTRLDDARVPSAIELGLSGIGKIFVKPAYTLRDMARDTLALMDALGIAKAHLVGASMGGMIVQEAAIIAPERLLSLTSFMSTTGDSKLPGATPKAAVMLMRPRPTDRESYLERFVEAWSVFNGKTLPFNAANMRRLGELAFSRGTNPAGAARQLQAIIVSGNRTPSLRNVRVPTLVLHGNDDPLVPIACGYATAKAIPKAKMTVLQGMGHLLSHEKWPQIIDAIVAHAAAAANRS